MTMENTQKTAKLAGVTSGSDWTEHIRKYVTYINDEKIDTVPGKVPSLKEKGNTLNTPTEFGGSKARPPLQPGILQKCHNRTEIYPRMQGCRKLRRRLSYSKYQLLVKAWSEPLKRALSEKQLRA